MTTAISSSMPAIQMRCFPCDVIRDICQAVCDIALRIIRAIGSCFSSTHAATTVNPLTQRVTMTGPQNLVEFYLGREPNNNGVRLNEIIAWDDDRLERQHNYIQWLFPLRTPSGPNPTAAVLDDATVHAFRTNPAIRTNIEFGAFPRMLRFYGLQMDSTTGVISRAPNFNTRSVVWLTPGNHNFLRITRMIESLGILGFENHSRAFFAIMQNIAQNEGNGIVGNSLTYWQRAVPV